MTTTIITLTVLTLALLAGCGHLRKRAPGHPAVLSNVAEAVHDGGRLTKKADAAISTRYLLARIGSDSDHVALCGANDRPIGVITDEADDAEDLLAVETFGAAKETKLMVASEAIAAGSLVFTAASGKVQNAPSVTGTYYCVGRALTAATADGNLIEVDPMLPLAYPVSPALLKRMAEAALTLAYTVAKQGTASGQANVCGAADRPLGVVAGTASQNAAVTVQLLNLQPLKMVASKPIGIGEGCYTAASGKIQNKPTATGTYYCLGTALEAATQDGDAITVLSQPPSIYVIP